MSVLGVFDRRYRGFRVIEIGGVGVLLALILLVYLAKTVAGGEDARIDHVQQQIATERTRVTLLRAEVASLEQPERLEALSGRYLGLQPVDPKHDIDVQALAGIVRASAPTPPASQGAAPPPPAAPAPVASMPAAGPAAVAPVRPAAARPVAVQAVATAPKAARPVAVKPLKIAAVSRPPVKTARAAIAPRAEEPQMAVAEPAPRRPSELKPAATDPIGSLVQAAQDATVDASQ